MYNYSFFVLRWILLICIVVLVAIYGINVICGVKSRIDTVYTYFVWLLTIPLALLASDLTVLFLLFEVSTLIIITTVGIFYNHNNVKTFPVLGRFYIFSLVSSAIFLFGCGWLLFMLPYNGAYTLHYINIHEFFLHFNFELKQTVIFVFEKIPPILRYFALCIGLLLIIFIYKLTMVPFSTWLVSFYQALPSHLYFTVLTAYKLTFTLAIWKFITVLSLTPEVSNFMRPFLFVFGALSLIGCAAGGYYSKDLKGTINYATISQNVSLIAAYSTGDSTCQAFATTSLIVYVIHILLTCIVFLWTHYNWKIDVSYFNNLNQLYVRNQWLGVCVLILNASLAGVPPFGGFITKYSLLVAIYNSGALDIFALNVAAFLLQFVIYAIVMFKSISKKYNKVEKINDALQYENSAFKAASFVTVWKIILVSFFVIAYVTIVLFGFYFIPLINGEMEVIQLMFRTGY